MLADGAVALTALWLAATLRFGSEGLGALMGTIPDPVPVLVAYLGGWVAALWLRGHYRSRTRLTVRREVLDIAQTTVIFGIVGLALLFASKESEVSRAVILVLMPMLAAGALASRLAIRAILVSRRAGGKNTRFVLVAGTGTEAQRFGDLIEAHPELGLRVIGHLAENGPSVSAVRGPILGRLADIERVMRERIVDEVAICLAPDHWEHMDDIAAIAAEVGKTVRIPAMLPARSLTIGTVETLDGVAIQSLARGPDHFVGLAAKRLLDIAGGAVGLAVVALPMSVIAALIWLDSPGPVFFRQTRIGLHGRPFSMLKFRTMVVDAEARRPELGEHNEIAGYAFKLTNDPRTTRVGRFLRKTSLDELPQLWNVLRGEMSLVGPRPPLPAEVADYDLWHRRRLSMTPGITGLWQVEGRREANFDRWVGYDLDYIDRWSFWLDLKILARTIPAMLAGR
jgi:exopolysaccharide biosynthesis polyprenyl glycosylphosphotransferase